jgi:hypothetical protein
VKKQGVKVMAAQAHFEALESVQAKFTAMDAARAAAARTSETEAGAREPLLAGVDPLERMAPAPDGEPSPDTRATMMTLEDHTAQAALIRSKFGVSERKYHILQTASRFHREKTDRRLPNEFAELDDLIGDSMVEFQPGDIELNPSLPRGTGMLGTLKKFPGWVKDYVFGCKWYKFNQHGQLGTLLFFFMLCVQVFIGAHIHNHLWHTIFNDAQLATDSLTVLINVSCGIITLKDYLKTDKKDRDNWDWAYIIPLLVTGAMIGLSHFGLVNHAFLSPSWGHQISNLAATISYKYVVGGLFIAMQLPYFFKTKDKVSTSEDKGINKTGKELGIADFSEDTAETRNMLVARFLQIMKDINEDAIKASITDEEIAKCKAERGIDDDGKAKQMILNKKIWIEMEKKWTEVLGYKHSARITNYVAHRLAGFSDASLSSLTSYRKEKYNTRDQRALNFCRKLWGGKRKVERTLIGEIQRKARKQRVYEWMKYISGVLNFVGTFFWIAMIALAATQHPALALAATGVYYGIQTIMNTFSMGFMTTSRGRLCRYVEDRPEIELRSLGEAG